MGNTTIGSTVPQRSWRRAFLRLLKAGIVCYVGVIVLLMLLETRIVFHPVRASEHWKKTPTNLRVEDVEVTAKDGVGIHAWWCPVAGWEPAQGAVLFCHGNGCNLSQRAAAVLQWQKEMGQAVLILDYPGYGWSEGAPTEAGCYAAADAVYEWLTQEQRISPEHVLLYGESLGGGVVVDLASRRPCRALVLEKTFTSVADTAQRLYPWLPARWLVRNRFDSLAKIRRCTRPLFIAHGTEDHLVPFALGERLFESANEPKQFLALQGLDHNSHTPAEFFTALRTFLAQTERTAETEKAGKR
jgi:fermentation-respiration switch protein FrsA (DUF1100 family)